VSLPHRLIFVEGIPGAGKTTTTQWLGDGLRARGLNASAHLEMDEAHPLHAFWSWGDGDADAGIITEPYSAPEFSRRLIHNLKLLVRQLVAEDRYAVVEAYPFQLGIRTHMRMGAGHGDLEWFFAEFQRALEPANPLLILIESTNIEATFRAAVADRGAWFEQALIKSITRCPYGRSHNLAGFEGTLRFYEDYGRIVDELSSRWVFSACRVCPDRDGWPEVTGQLERVTSCPNEAQDAQ